ncbi:hypothetical protein Gotur_008824 [Gossypium turneri]
MWPGIRCNAGSVVDIDLGGHGLNERITPPIGALSKLKLLDLSNNQFIGPIPSSVSNLTNLSSLFLSMASNLLEGPIPREIESLNVLEYLNLSGNKLSRPIPTHIGNLPNLRYLILAKNNLSGDIPSQINSQSIELSHNLL